MDLWKRGMHSGLVGNAEAGGVSREVRAASGGKEEYESVARSYHDAVLSVKLRQAIRRATNREGGGCLLPDDQCTKTGKPVSEVLWEKYLDMCVSPVDNPTCTTFEKYGEGPKTVPLDFMEDDMTRVASKLSVAAVVPGAEAMELCNRFLCFRCASEELRVIIISLGD